LTQNPAWWVPYSDSPEEVLELRAFFMHAVPEVSCAIVSWYWSVKRIPSAVLCACRFMLMLLPPHYGGAPGFSSEKIRDLLFFKTDLASGPLRKSIAYGICSGKTAQQRR
jgi:hypothetical protein